MNTPLHARHLKFVMLALALASACRDSTPIGSVECIGQQIRCLAKTGSPNPNEVLQPPWADPVTSLENPVLAPAWTGQPFEGLDEQALWFGLQLRSDRDGNLWSAAASGTQLSLSQLDRDGTALDAQLIDAPSASPELYHLADLSFDAGSAFSWPTIHASWSRGCEGDHWASDCQLDEVLVFEDLARAPRRLPNVQYQLLVNDTGEWRVRGPVVDRMDGQGKLVWRQTGGLGGNSNPRQARAALRADDQVAVFVPMGEAYGPDAEIWHLDALGNVATRRYLNWSSGNILHAVDSRGNDLVVSDDQGGDLTMARVLPNGEVQGAMILREEYRALHPDAFAVDSEGSAYVASTPGSRKNLRALLCQLHITGSTRCLTLGELAGSGSAPLVDDLVVPEPGVAYVRTGPELRRYALQAE